MLLIRQKQMHILQEAISLEFETRLAQHLHQAFTRQMLKLGEESVRAFIHAGVTKARIYGYAAERDFFLFLCIMLMLGSHFDEDPQLPWVAVHLAQRRSKETTAGHEALMRLHQATMDYLDQVAGENNEHLIRALLRLREYDVGQFRAFSQDEGRLLDELVQVCGQWYPQKAEHSGEKVTRQAMTLALGRARGHGFRSTYAQGIFCALVFMLGFGFDEDKQYPWAQSALAKPVKNDGEAFAQELYTEAMAYLQFGLRSE